MMTILGAALALALGVTTVEAAGPTLGPRQELLPLIPRDAS